MATVDKTWVFASDNEGLADVGDSSVYNMDHDTSGNPGGALEPNCPSPQVGTLSERARKASTGETWETWGVPAGNIVTDVQIISYDFKMYTTTNVTSENTKIRIVDSAAATVHSAGDLIDQNQTLDTAWNNKGSGTSRAVNANRQASTTDVRLEVQETIVLSAGATHDANIDNILLRMTYSAGGIPAKAGAGIMGPDVARFPVIQASATSSTNTAGTNHVVEVSNLSAAAGDLILILMNIGSTSATLNAHADYTELLDEASATGLKILYRFAAGGEGDPTFVSSANTRDASIALRISGVINPATRAPQIGTTATGSSTTPNPPSVTPSMGPQEYLAVTFCGSAGEQADDGSYCTGFPSGYALANLEKTCGTAGTNLGGMIACAAANLQQGTAIDPGTFTVSENNTWRSQTIIIHPLALNTAETGSGIITLNGSGAIPHTPVTYQKAGKATLGIAAAEVGIPPKAGAGISARSGTAADLLLWVESGGGVGSRVAGSAVDLVIRQETGNGISGRSAAGRAVVETAKTGAGVSPRAGTAADTLLWPETGIGARGHVGSGASQKQGGAAKAGSGIAGFSGIASDQIAWTESGAGLSSRTGSSGPDAVIFQEIGAGVSARSGIAADELVWPEDGKGILSAVGSGAKVVVGQGTTYAKAGIAIMGLAFVPSITKTGAGVLSLVGAGISQKVGPGKSGSGVSARLASGARAVVYVEADAGGGDAPEPPSLEADHPAQIVFKASGIGTKVGGTTYAKQNSGIAVFSALGKDTLIHVQQHGGILVASGSGADQAIRGETGSGISDRIGSGVKQLAGGATYIKQNAGIASFVGAASDQAISVESGAGISARVAGGSETKSGVSAKQNAGVSAFSATAADELLWIESGAGIRGSAGSGSKAAGGEKFGSGIRGSVGAGKDTLTHVQQEGGILAAVGSGSDAAIHPELGAGVRGQIGSGAKETVLGARYDKSGARIRVSTGGGIRQRLVLRTGSGILERSGIATDVVAWNERGLATLTLSGSGERKYGVMPGAVEISDRSTVSLETADRITVSLEIGHGNGATVGVVDRRKATARGR